MRRVHVERSKARAAGVTEENLPKFMEQTLAHNKNCPGCVDRIEKNKLSQMKMKAKRAANQQ